MGVYSFESQFTSNFRPSLRGELRVGTTTSGVYSIHWKEPGLGGKPGSQVQLVSADYGLTDEGEAIQLANLIIASFQEG